MYETIEPIRRAIHLRYDACLQLCLGIISLSRSLGPSVPCAFTASSASLAMNETKRTRLWFALIFSAVGALLPAAVSMSTPDSVWYWGNFTVTAIFSIGFVLVLVRMDYENRVRAFLLSIVSVGYYVGIRWFSGRPLFTDYSMADFSLTSLANLPVAFRILVLMSSITAVYLISYSRRRYYLMETTPEERVLNEDSGHP